MSLEKKLSFQALLASKSFRELQEMCKCRKISAGGTTEALRQKLLSHFDATEKVDPSGLEWFVAGIVGAATGILAGATTGNLVGAALLAAFADNPERASKQERLKIDNAIRDSTVEDLKVLCRQCKISPVPTRKEALQRALCAYYGIGAVGRLSKARKTFDLSRSIAKIKVDLEGMPKAQIHTLRAQEVKGNNRTTLLKHMDTLLCSGDVAGAAAAMKGMSLGGFDLSRSIAKIKPDLDGMPKAQLRRLRAREMKGKNRTTLLKHMDELL